MSRTNCSNDWVCDSPKNDIDEMACGTDLSDMMECPYCLEMPLPPVYLCLTGHLICSTCRTTLKKCGLCASAFAETRNFFYENLFEKTKFACKYFGEGCKENMLGKVLKEHQEACEYRPIPCLKYGCDNSKAGKHVAYAKYLDHFKVAHNSTFNSGPDGTVCNGISPDAEAWTLSRWVHEIYQFKGHTFFVNCQVRKPEVGIWLWFLGTEEEAKKFRVKITLGSLSDTNDASSATSWEGPVHCIRKPFESIMDQGLCLTTSIHTVKALCKTGEFEVSRAYWEVNFIIQEKKTSKVFGFQGNSPLQQQWSARPPIVSDSPINLGASSSRVSVSSNDDGASNEPQLNIDGFRVMNLNPVRNLLPTSPPPAFITRSVSMRQPPPPRSRYYSPRRLRNRP